MIESWVENRTISIYDVWSNAKQVQNYRQDYFAKLTWRDVKETYLCLISQQQQSTDFLCRSWALDLYHALLRQESDTGLIGSD